MARFPRFWVISAIISCTSLALAQGTPYFVTYDDHLEEAGELEISTSSTIGVARSGQNTFVAPYAELEYGVKEWWTSALYLEGQTTFGDSALFTGWRLENRFLPIGSQHKVNPVLYLEYENINEASRIEKEIVGFSPIEPEPNSELQQVHAHELEGKLILSSDFYSWNFAGNFIVERNLSEDEGFEFGYSFGLARPLAKTATYASCRWCRDKFSAGLELYGGLGNTRLFGFHETAHYAAFAISWQVGAHSSIHLSPGIGLTHNSYPVLLRFGYSYEIENFGRKLAELFGRPGRD
jgi:hypothetical protein